MISSKVLFQKFSNLIGIPISDARLGFEVFAKQVDQKFSFGDQLEIQPLGYFALKKISPSDDEKVKSETAIIYSSNKINSDTKDFLLFFVPTESNASQLSIDSFLNLSVGKKLINPGTVPNAAEYPIVHANELLGLMESKVEKLIADSTVYHSEQTDEQELVISKKLKDDIVFDTGLENEPSKTDTGLEEIKKFELVEPVRFDTSDEMKTGSAKNGNWFIDDNALQEEIEKQDENVEIIEGFTEIKSDSFQPATPESIEFKKFALPKEQLSHKPKSKFGKRLVFSILTLVLAAAAALAVYFNNTQFKSLVDKYLGTQVQVLPAVKRITPNIVERTPNDVFKPALTFNEARLSAAPDSLIISSIIFLPPKPPSSESEITELKSSGEEILNDQISEVGENIYKKNDEYVVQVSSWKSKPKAISEVNKLIAKGFAASIEEFSQAGSGIYYRVRVGGFKSIKEVNDFLNKNK